MTIAGLATLVLVAGAVADGDKPARTDADAGLTDVQLNAKHAAARGVFEARLADWYAHLDVSTLDLAALPHGELAVLLREPAATFGGAVASADRIVLGDIASIQPGGSGTIVTLTVERTLKGASAAMVNFRQGSTLLPTVDWSGTMIADSPGAPLLLPGTRGEFLLEKASDGVLDLQEPTGDYILAAAGVHTVAINPFAGQFRGAPESALIQATMDAAK